MLFACADKVKAAEPMLGRGSRLVLLPVSWDDTFGFDLTIFEERSAPPFGSGL